MDFARFLALSLIFSFLPFAQATESSWFDKGALGGHQVQILPNGVATHRARIRLIEQSTRSIYLSSFAFLGDQAALEIADRLCRKAEEGVDVRLLLDNYESKVFEKHARKLRDCGAKVLFFNTRVWFLPHFVYAAHEKLLISDGREFIVGGSGYGNKYFRASRQSGSTWHDLDALVRGPGACWFHNRFIETWRESVSRDRNARFRFIPSRYIEDFLYGEDQFESCSAEVVGKSNVLSVYGNPLFADEVDTLQVHINAILSSRRSIRLYSSYFVPSEELVDALLQARKNGVRVTIITNSPWSSDEVRYVQIGMLRAASVLAKAGVKVMVWNRKSMNHRKGGVYDNRWAYFGSFNLDRRGSDYSSESMIFTDDRDVVDQMNEEINEDLKHTILLTPNYVQRLLESYGWFDVAISKTIAKFL